MGGHCARLCRVPCQQRNFRSGAPGTRCRLPELVWCLHTRAALLGLRIGAVFVCFKGVCVFVVGVPHYHCARVVATRVWDCRSACRDVCEGACMKNTHAHTCVGFSTGSSSSSGGSSCSGLSCFALSLSTHLASTESLVHPGYAHGLALDRTRPQLARCGVLASLRCVLRHVWDSFA